MHNTQLIHTEKKGFDLTSSAVLYNYSKVKPFDPGNFIGIFFFNFYKYFDISFKDEMGIDIFLKY